MEEKKRVWVAVGVIENERGDHAAPSSTELGGHTRLRAYRLPRQSRRVTNPSRQRVFVCDRGDICDRFATE